jgi:hypothetical protein
MVSAHMPILQTAGCTAVPSDAIRQHKPAEIENNNAGGNAHGGGRRTSKTRGFKHEEDAGGGGALGEEKPGIMTTTTMVRLLDERYVRKSIPAHMQLSENMAGDGSARTHHDTYRTRLGVDICAISHGRSRRTQQRGAGAAALKRGGGRGGRT